MYSFFCQPQRGVYETTIDFVRPSTPHQKKKKKSGKKKKRFFFLFQQKKRKGSREKSNRRTQMTTKNTYTTHTKTTIYLPGHSRKAKKKEEKRQRRENKNKNRQTETFFCQMELRSTALLPVITWLFYV